MKHNYEITGRPMWMEDVEFGEDGGRAHLYGLNRDKPYKPALVIWSWGGGWDHVSVSFRDRCPTWDEMCRVKDMFFYPDECCVEYHPAKADYVNICNTCLHIWRPQNVELPKPPKELV